MARELKKGDQCEYAPITGSPDKGYRRDRCALRYLDRVEGKPVQLIPVKQGRSIAFMCHEHAALYSGTEHVKRQRPRAVQAEQQRLV